MTKALIGRDCLQFKCLVTELFQVRCMGGGPILKWSPNNKLPVSRIETYRKLKIPSDLHVATYVWIDATGDHLRGKSRTFDFKPKCAEECPKWSFDGSSTGQATREMSDTELRPVVIYKDPFWGKYGTLVLCTTYNCKGEPLPTNHRVCCLDAMDQICEMKPQFGIEQEFTFVDMNRRPFGFLPSQFPRPQGPYYCSVGASRAWGRHITDAHYAACLYMGLKIAGTNAEVLPSQWEYQIGPCDGIDCADQIWISRYVLWRIAEEYGVGVTLDPKPVKGNWNGSGAHCNVSTEETRGDGGIGKIKEAITKLSKKHARHIAAYDPRGGEDNKRRLTGKHETSSIKQFTSGEANRSVSVRIPRSTVNAGKGYFEDRRPASNADPYSVMNVIARTCFLNQ